MSKFSNAGTGRSFLEAKRKLLEIYLRGEGRYSRAIPGQVTPRPYRRDSTLSLAQRTSLDSRNRYLAGTPLPTTSPSPIKASGWLNAAVVERSFAEIVRETRNLEDQL